MCGFFVLDTVLTSEVFGISENPNDVCLQDRLVYTCTVSNFLRWSVGGVLIGAYLDSDDVGTTHDNPARFPGVEANLTANGTVLTSTLTISSPGDIMNGSIILCEGSGGDSNSMMLRYRGEIPGCYMITKINQVSTG